MLDRALQSHHHTSMTEDKSHHPQEPIGNYEDLPDYLLAEPVGDSVILANLRQIKETADKYPDHEIGHQFTHLHEQLAQYYPIGGTLLVAYNKYDLTIIKHTGVRELYQAFSSLDNPAQHTLQETARRAMARLLQPSQSKADRIDSSRHSLEEYAATFTLASKQATHLSGGNTLYNKDVDTRTQATLRSLAKGLFTAEGYYEFSATNLVLMLLQSVPNPDGAWDEYIKTYLEQFTKISKAIADEKYIQYAYRLRIKQNERGFPMPNDNSAWGKARRVARRESALYTSQIKKSQHTITNLENEAKALCSAIINQLVPPSASDIQTYEQPPDIDYKK